MVRADQSGRRRTILTMLRSSIALRQLCSGVIDAAGQEQEAAMDRMKRLCRSMHFDAGGGVDGSTQLKRSPI